MPPLERRQKEWIGAGIGIVCCAGLMGWLWYFEVSTSRDGVTLGRIIDARTQLARYFLLHSSYPTRSHYQSTIDVAGMYQPLTSEGAPCSEDTAHTVQCGSYRIPFSLETSSASLPAGSYFADPQGVHRTPVVSK